MIPQDARKVALEALIKIERGICKANEALEQVYDTLSPQDRGLLTELVYGVLRHRNRLDWVLGQFCKESVDRLSPTVKNILRLGAYQLLFLDKIPSHAAVDEAVRLTKGKDARGLSGFVNAVLRSIDRGRQAITYPDPSGDRVQHLSIFYSHPEWMIRRWLQRYGPEQTSVICQANNEIPPVTLRVNTPLTTREELWADLKNQGLEVEPCAVSPLGLKVKDGAVLHTSAYQKGWFYIQDEAAQLVVVALDPKPGEVILDACAAPGGKTTHMAQNMANQGRIIALDIQEQRLERIRQNCQRLGVRIVETRLGDARKSATLFKDLQFDRILIDAPCSGQGVLRRNPEGKWAKTEDLIPHYAKLQSEILEAVSPRLKEGGVLVYSTCSIEPEENERVVEAFVRQHPEYRVQDLHADFPASVFSLITRQGFLFTLFNQYSMDHFFVAKLIKESKGGPR